MKGKRLPKFLSREKVDKLIDHVSFFRHRAMVLLMYSLALRIQEVVNIRLSDIDEDQLLIHIYGKGNVERIIPLDEKLWSIIIDVLQIYKPRLYLFEDSHGKPYGTRQLRQIIYQAADTAMIGHVHPHMLRHSKATHLFNENKSIRAIQALLGHANIETTAIYMGCAVDNLRIALYSAN